MADPNRKQIKVNYKTKCAVCKAVVEAGTMGTWDPSDSSIRHPECAGEVKLDPKNPEKFDDVDDGYFHEDEDDFVEVGADEDTVESGEGTPQGESEGEGESESEDEGEDSDGDGESEGEQDDSEEDSDGENESEDSMENPFPEGTRRHEIIEQHKAGKDPYVELVPKVEAQIEPFVLTKRVEGIGKVARPMEDRRDAAGKTVETGQKTEFKYEVNRTIAAYEKAKQEKGEGKEQSKEGKGKEDGKPKPQMKPNLAKQADHFVKEMQRIRASLDSQAGESNAGRVDHVSYRPVQYGVRMLLNGISPGAALYAFSLHWPKESRQFHGIKEHNPVKDAGAVPEGEPLLLGYVRKLAQARVPIMLVGPAGAGKSRMAEQLANIDFNGRFGSVPLTAGIMPSWLIGSHTVDGWKSRPFLDIYENGGVFAFEEMDSADPNVLLIINNAIANGYLDNPHDGRRYEMHENFQPVACCNTLGLGADRFYVGRERLDFATIDRFRMGRVMIGMDNDVDFSILQKELDAHVG